MSFLKVINIYKSTLKRKLLKDIPLSLISDNLKTKYPDISINRNSLVTVNSFNESKIPLHPSNSLNLYMFESLFYKDGKDTGYTSLTLNEDNLNALFRLRAVTLASLGYKADIQYLHKFTFTIRRDYTSSCIFLTNESDTSDTILSFPLHYLNYTDNEDVHFNEGFQKSIVKTIFELLDFSMLSEEEYLYIKENCIKE